MEDSYKKLESGHAEYIKLLNPETEQVLIHNTDRDMDSMYDELYVVHMFINSVKLNSRMKKKNDKQKESVKVKKLDALILSGEIREFSSFKRDYESSMYPTYGTDPTRLH